MMYELFVINMVVPIQKHVYKWFAFYIGSGIFVDFWDVLFIHTEVW